MPSDYTETVQTFREKNNARFQRRALDLLNAIPTKLAECENGAVYLVHHEVQAPFGAKARGGGYYADWDDTRTLRLWHGMDRALAVRYRTLLDRIQILFVVVETPAWRPGAPWRLLGQWLRDLEDGPSDVLPNASTGPKVIYDRASFADLEAVGLPLKGTRIDLAPIGPPPAEYLGGRSRTS
jgi:hypothetical protein